MTVFADLVIGALLMTAVIVSGSDVNWGKKVPCFVVQGTVVCPGCNTRAGLSCPRKLKNSRNCLEPVTETPYPQTPMEEVTKGLYRNPTTILETTYDEINSTETTSIPTSTQSPESNEILTTPHENPIDSAIEVYRRLGNGMSKYRYRRQAQLEQMVQEEDDNEEENCNWNADCPCPLICCKTGPGCPKICVMGIRLPPPWG